MCITYANRIKRPASCCRTLVLSFLEIYKVSISIYLLVRLHVICVLGTEKEDNSSSGSVSLVYAVCAV